MPNIKSAKKRVKTTSKARIANGSEKAAMRSSIKKVEKETNKEEAIKLLNDATKKIDKAASKGLVHKNYASRQKSILTIKVNSL